MRLVVARFFAASVVLGLILVIAAWLVAKTDMFLGVRQNVVEGVLADVMQRPVTIDGDVSVSLLGDVEVVIENVNLEPVTNRASALNKQFVRRIEFGAPLSTLLGAGDAVRFFHVAGANIDLGVVDDGDAQQSADPEDSAYVIGLIASRFLLNPLSRDLQISDVVLSYRNERDGWDEKIVIDLFESRESADREFIDIKMSGSINETPLNGSMRVADPLHAITGSGLQFSMQLTTSGLSGQAVGSLYPSFTDPSIQAEINLSSESINDLLDTLLIERTVEGKLSSTATLEGPFEALKVSNVFAKARSTLGETMVVTGGIGNLVKGSGIALDFDTELAPETLDPETSDTLLDLSLTGYSGRLAGSLENLRLENATIHTNIANVELREVGPISIGRIVKDENNRVGLLDIRILDGRPENPTLELSGNVRNLLSLTQVELDGTFDLPLDSLDPDDEHTVTPRLGRLVGSVAIADGDGRLGLDTLSGRSEGTDLWQVEFDMGVGEFRRLDDIELRTSVTIPNMKAFGDATGGGVESEEGASFRGDLALGGPALWVIGEAAVGRTTVNAELLSELANDFTLLSGKVTSPLVRLSDINALVDLVSTPDLDAIEIEIEDDVTDALKADILFEFGRVTDGKDATGKASGKFSFAEAQMHLHNLAIEYLGGSIVGDFTADLRKDTPVFYANGRIRKWRLGRLLAELGLPAPISGTLYLSVNGLAQGTSSSALIRSMNGQATASLWGGRVQGRLLDATGLNLVSWMFAANETDSSRIVCAVVPLNFKNGRATGNRIIIETDNVQIVGGGRINLPQNSFNLSFLPRPKLKQAVNIVSPFTVHGMFDNPQVTMEEGKGARVFAEIISLPINLIGHIFTRNRPIQSGHKPCTLPKNSGPK